MIETRTIDGTVMQRCGICKAGWVPVGQPVPHSVDHQRQAAAIPLCRCGAKLADGGAVGWYCTLGWQCPAPLRLGEGDLEWGAKVKQTSILDDCKVIEFPKVRKPIRLKEAA